MLFLTVRLFSSSSHFFSSSFSLIRCTVLHKCDDESGCCENDAFHCVAKSQQPVNLYFYVVLAGNGSTVEMLTFTNDTECECREMNYEPRVKELAWATPEVVTQQPLPSSTTTTSTTSTTSSTFPPDYFSEELSKRSLALQQNKGKEQLCSHIDCPNPFSARLLTNHLPHKCSCDCIDGDFACHRTKRGQKRMEWGEVRCVQRGDCLEPTCEYGGGYDMVKGRCPHKTGSDNYKPTHRLRHEKKHYAHERD